MIASVGRMMRKGGGGLSWPAGMKEHIKAIYDPAKQGMTNYDVIEAYVEDFTTWHYLSSRGTATVTTNKIIITKSFSNIQNIIEDNKSPYDDIKIYVTGISKDNPLTVNQYVDNKWVRLHTYTTDGIYIIKNRNLYVGFGTYITDNCNITITQLPTSILQDLSGNGNHAYLYGGKGKLNSGMGVYQEDFSINTWNKTSFVFDYSHDYIKAKFKTINAGHRNVIVSNSNVSLNSMKIKVIIKGNSKDNRIMYSYADENGVQKVYYINNGETGIVPKSIATKTNDFLVGFRYNENNGDDCEITITQIPDYPDQLCYDGKMYAVCYGFPILTDYTVMADRTWFDKMNRACFLSKITTSGTGAFGFEFYNEYNKDTTYSFGRTNDVEQFKDGITWQITNSYNGIVKLDYIVNGKDNAELYIGKLRPSERPAFIGCHGAIIVADRSFTEEEINWLKDNLFRK